MSVERRESIYGFLIRSRAKIEIEPHRELSKLDKATLQTGTNFVMITLGTYSKQVFMFVRNEINACRETISPIESNILNAILRHEIIYVWKPDPPECH